MLAASGDLSWLFRECQVSIGHLTRPLAWSNTFCCCLLEKCNIAVVVIIIIIIISSTSRVAVVPSNLSGMLAHAGCVGQLAPWMAAVGLVDMYRLLLVHSVVPLVPFMPPSVAYQPAWLLAYLFGSAISRTSQLHAQLYSCECHVIWPHHQCASTPVFVCFVCF